MSVHEIGWHYGYVTCKCGWAWNAKTVHDLLDTQFGHQMFYAHEQSVAPKPEPQPITEDWLRSVGFRWHQFDRQNEKQWLLWLGDAVRDGRSFVGTEDLGIELSSTTSSEGDCWSVWVRGDYSHRYSRFIHIRYITVQSELIAMVEGLVGVPWNPENHRRGCLLTPIQAQRDREADQRLDRRIMREGHPWRDIEKDDSRGGALPEHMQHAIDAGMAK